jgi:hypothetical protein
MSGYYSDPVSDPALRKSVKSTMTHTNKQTCFAPATDNLFRAILGSQKTRTGSRFFIEGEYTFAFGPTENGSYIELTHISFNSTNRTDGTTSEIQRPAGDGARRRNVKPKEKAQIASSSVPATPQNNRFQTLGAASTISPSPAPARPLSTQYPSPAQPQFGSPPQYEQPQQQPSASQHSLHQQRQSVATHSMQSPPHTTTTPTYSQSPSQVPDSSPVTPYAGTSVYTTPATGVSTADPISMPLAPAYQLDDFLDIDDIPSSQPRQETVSPSELSKGKRRAESNSNNYLPSGRPKRTRKPTAKASALQFLDTEAVDDTERSVVHITDNEDNEEYL